MRPVALSGWVDYVAETSRSPVVAFPTLTVLHRLSDTFGAIAAWNRLGASGELEWVVLHPPPGWPPPGAIGIWRSRQLDHPLVRWFGTTPTVDPMTMERVPESVADRRTTALVRELLGSPEMAQQLAIPIEISRRATGVFVLSRGGQDFTDDQLALAKQLQPLLMVLERRADLTARLELDVAHRFGLTARESAVLCLMRRGMLVHSIGRQLGCSPRTVEKHLEHLYRKLGVRDRLGAVRVTDAHEAGAAPAGRDAGALADLAAGGGGRADLYVFRGKIRPASRVHPGQPPAV